MKVLFDAYWWASGPAALRHIMREIIFEWAEQFPDDELVALVRHRHFEQARQELPAQVEILSTHLRPQAVLASLGTALAARKVRPDVIFTHNFASLRRPCVVFIQDVLFRTNPEWFTRKERMYFSLMTPLARRATRVLSSSVEERRRMMREIGPQAIDAVGIGISEELLRSSSIAPDLDVIPGRFLLSVSRLNIRKNLARACIGCIDQNLISAERPLVVVGPAQGAQDDNVDQRITDAIENRAILFTGHVAEENLHWLYENAEVLIYPSLGEGFGMPPFEAMAFGTPVVASDIPVLRENLGNSAYYADPLDSNAIGLAVSAATGSARSEEQIAKLKAHGRSHRWDGVVRDIRKSCEKVRR